MQKEHVDRTAGEDAGHAAERMMEEFDRSVERPSPEAEALARAFEADIDRLAAEEVKCLEAMFFKDH